MRVVNNKAEGVKITYIGGGSRGWAWGLMSDLVVAEDMSGDVYLYDIDFEAAKKNEIIGNKYNSVEGAKTHWDYHAVETIDEALKDANFVVISILPGTFDEMESDVHVPEKYGIYQSVGDTSGPGGIVRALRTLPMMEEIAKAVERNCPEAWVINYTNPMTLCVKALYDTFPKIKAFGCCHEVFGTQKLITEALKDIEGIEVDESNRADIKVNVLGVNHFTWLDKAQYHDLDVFPVYKKFCKKYRKDGFLDKYAGNWLNTFFMCLHQVKMDLFLRYGVIAAAGDRHLAEFCEGKWYLESPEKVKKMGFGLTPVSWRKETLQNRLERSRKLISGEEKLKLAETGEEGVLQMRALLGLHDFVTNVNIPNVGQIPNLPLGAVVETNATFRSNELRPVMAGPIPEQIYPLIMRISSEQEVVAKGIKNRDLEMVFEAFANDPLVTIPVEDSRKLFKEMIENTKAYLGMYDVDGFKA